MKEYKDCKTIEEILALSEERQEHKKNMKLLTDKEELNKEIDKIFKKYDQ